MKVGNKYKLMGAVFLDTALLENANIFKLVDIEAEGTAQERYIFNGVSTSQRQVCHKTTIKAGLAIINEVG